VQQGAKVQSRTRCRRRVARALAAACARGARSFRPSVRRARLMRLAWFRLSTGAQVGLAAASAATRRAPCAIRVDISAQCMVGCAFRPHVMPTCVLPSFPIPRLHQIHGGEDVRRRRRRLVLHQRGRARHLAHALGARPVCTAIPYRRVRTRLCVRARARAPGGRGRGVDAPAPMCTEGTDGAAAAAAPRFFPAPGS